MSQVELAKQTKLSRQTIGRLENGEAVHRSTLKKVCLALGIEDITTLTGITLYSAVQSAARRKQKHA